VYLRGLTVAKVFEEGMGLKTGKLCFDQRVSLGRRRSVLEGIDVPSAQTLFASLQRKRVDRRFCHNK
jgi:hypothetical protein